MNTEDYREGPGIDQSESTIDVEDWIKANGPEVQVAFTVPVEAVVDLATGEVTRVVEIGEGIAMVQESDGLPEVHIHEGFVPVTNPRVRERAGEIADDGPDWPAWEHGW